MPADEYTSVVRGGLKLKGSAPSGVSKKKKKDKKKPKAADGESESKKDALRKALEDEDSAIVKAKAKGEGGGEGEEGGDRELEERGNDGKTASERAYEEMRRKRVSCSLLSFFLSLN
jgi:protein FAM32A